MFPVWKVYCLPSKMHNESGEENSSPDLLLISFVFYLFLCAVRADNVGVFKLSD